MFVVASFARQTFDNSLQLLLLLHGLWRCSSLVSSFVWPDHLLLGCDAISLRSSYYNCTYYYYYYTTRQLTERAAGGGKLTLLPAALTWSCQSCSDRPTEWYPHTQRLLSSVSVLTISLRVCVRIHWSLSCCPFQRSAASVFLLPGCVCVLICQLFPFVVWIATTIHSVQPSQAEIPSVDIGNILFILFFFWLGLRVSTIFASDSPSLPHTFDVRLGSAPPHSSVQ